ncbi:MAG: hypothetical protein GX790_04490 [Syntrophomonadaceae bacterium]|nr:hypothetical protein [Syntrophomonadaceae bacterium]
MKVTKFTQKIEYWAAENKIVYNIASCYYKDIIRREAKLANINNRDHVLCIGGGPCPFSAILLHQATGAKITVIDNIKHCVTVAKQLVTRMGLDDYINVMHQDGVEVELNNYTVILLALQVSPLESVLENLHKKARPGTRLLIRRPRECLSKLYSNLSTKWLKDCIAINHKGARNIGNTLLCIKQESFNEDKMAILGISRPHAIVGSIAV